MRMNEISQRFTDRVQEVMRLANQEAQRDHQAIDTEHILLGLVKEGKSVAANVLQNLEVDQRKILLEIEKIIRFDSEKVTQGELPQSPRVKAIIDYANEESQKMNHNYVGSEHILLGLLREKDGVASQVLERFEVTVKSVRMEVLRLLDPAIKNP